MSIRVVLVDDHAILRSGLRRVLDAEDDIEVVGEAESADRAVFETLGMQDVVAKSLGSSNPYNVVRATFDALKHQDSPRSVAARRNIKVSTLQSRRRDGDAEAAAD